MYAGYHAVCCSSVAKSCPTFHDPVDCGPPGSSDHEISQAGTLKWVAISFSRGSFCCRDWTCVCCIAGGFFTTEPSGKPGYQAERVWYSQTYRRSVAHQSSAELTAGSFGWVKLSLFLTKPGPWARGMCTVFSLLSLPLLVHTEVCVVSCFSPAESCFCLFLIYALMQSTGTEVCAMQKHFRWSVGSVRKMLSVLLCDVESLDLEEGMATHSSILAWRIPINRGAWWATVLGVAKNTTGWLNKHSTESLEWPSGELSFWISLPGKGVTSLMNALSSCGQSELYNSSSFPLCCWLLGRQIQMCGLKELGLFWTENLSQTGLHQTGFVGSCKEKAVGGPVGPGGLSHSL